MGEGVKFYRCFLKTNVYRIFQCEHRCYLTALRYYNAVITPIQPTILTSCGSTTTDLGIGGGGTFFRTTIATVRLRYARHGFITVAINA